jgi:hypothetical protein
MTQLLNSKLVMTIMWISVMPSKAIPRLAKPLGDTGTELDHYSEQADILGKAYDYGHHNLLDGCLVPLLEQLNTLIAAQIQQSAVRAQIQELERVLDNIHQGTLEPAVQARLKELREQL